MHKIVFERLLGNDLPLPKYQTNGSACFDISACLSRQLSECLHNGRKKQFIYNIWAANLRKYVEDPKEIIFVEPDMARLYLQPNETILIPTGFKVSFNPDLVLKLYIRSSIGINGLSLANQVGIIDSDYRGEVFLAIKNNSEIAQTINHGDRIAQAMLECIVKPEIIDDVVDETARNDGGFGSTGRK
jgi:dUTP pyrophosphatase